MYSPGGSKILNEPHLQQQLPYVTKTMVFHLFFLIEQLLSHVCGDIAYSAQRPPQGRICEFHDLYQLFSKFLLFPRTYALFVPASCDESKVVIAVFRLLKNHHFCNSSYFVGFTTTFGSRNVLLWVFRCVFFSSIFVNS